jgi:hypothetical protein
VLQRKYAGRCTIGKRKKRCDRKLDAQSWNDITKRRKKPIACAGAQSIHSQCDELYQECNQNLADVQNEQEDKRESMKSIIAKGDAMMRAAIAKLRFNIVNKKTLQKCAADTAKPSECQVRLKTDKCGCFTDLESRRGCRSTCCAMDRHKSCRANKRKELWSKKMAAYEDRFWRKSQGGSVFDQNDKNRKFFQTGVPVVDPEKIFSAELRAYTEDPSWKSFFPKKRIECGTDKKVATEREPVKFSVTPAKACRSITHANSKQRCKTGSIIQDCKKSCCFAKNQEALTGAMIKISEGKEEFGFSAGIRAVLADKAMEEKDLECERSGCKRHNGFKERETMLRCPGKCPSFEELSEKVASECQGAKGKGKTSCKKAGNAKAKKKVRKCQLACLTCRV